MSSGTRKAALARRSADVVMHSLRRLYGIVLIVVIVWLTYSALRYLVRSLVSPTSTPAQIAALPKRLDAEMLTGSRTQWEGLLATENPRGPLAHYHRFDTWVEPDRFNDCTRSGCHSVLPHTRNQGTRAFLNMHATSMHCGVCHMQATGEPLELLWYDLDHGRRSEPPAALRAIARLHERSFEQVDRAWQRQLAALLRETAAKAKGDPQLERIADYIEVVRPGSEPLQRLLGDAVAAVRRVFRGSYGAKLALRGSDGKPQLGHPGAADAARRWLVNGPNAVGPAREQMLRDVHTARRQAPLACDACHREVGSLIDFASLGYPPVRTQMLFHGPIFEMIRNIGEGRPFRLPSLGGSAAQPAAPTSQPPP